MAINRILDQMKDGQLELPEGWGQGRTLFGGIMAAVLLKSIFEKTGQDVAVRSLNIQLVAPPAPGPVHCEAEILRQGKSVIQAQSRCIQNGQVVSLMTASLARPRESRLNLNYVPRPEFEMPDISRQLPYVAGLAPEFKQHYEIIYEHGGLPYSSSPEPGVGGWIRETDKTDRFDVLSLVAMIDAWPPGILPVLDSWAAVSTLSWTLEILKPIEGYSSEAWWQYISENEFTADGYEHSRARLWDASGQLIALSRQCVTVFV